MTCVLLQSSRNNSTVICSLCIHVQPVKTTQTFSEYLEELETVRRSLQSVRTVVCTAGAGSAIAAAHSSHSKCIICVGALSLQLWDSREVELKQLEAQLQAVYHDIAEPAPPAFAHIGANMTTARIQEYVAEIQCMTAVKAERASEITALCSEVLGLWEELAFAPAEEDALEMGIPQGVTGVGYAQCTIIALKTKVQELTEEKVRSRRVNCVQKTALTRIAQTHHRLRSPTPTNRADCA